MAVRGTKTPGVGKTLSSQDKVIKGGSSLVGNPFKGAGKEVIKNAGKLEVARLLLKAIQLASELGESDAIDK